MALQTIRDKLQGMIAKIIVGIIAVPFLVFGVEQLFLDGGNNAAAEVNGIKVPETDLMRAIYQQKLRLQAEMGDRIDPKLLDDNALRKPVLDQLIDRTLLVHFASDAGMRVGERDVDQSIVATPEFQQDGKFSAALYSSVLASNSWTPVQYREQIREQMLISQLVAGLAGSALTTQDELAHFVRVVNEKRDFRYRVLSIADALKHAQVSEQEVQAYYDARPDDFMTEESVAVEYVELLRDAFAQAVPEEEIRKQYDQEVAALSLKKERQAAHIFLPAKDDKAAAEAIKALEDVKARLDKGADFAELARKESRDKGSASKGGELGFSSGDAFPAVFEEALQTLKVGEVSAPVRSEKGVHLIKLLSERAAEVPSFEQRREAIRTELALRGAEPRFVEAAEQLADSSFNAPDLRPVAEQFKLKILRAGPFGRKGGQGIAAEPSVIAAAFSDDVLKGGNNSEVLELGKGRMVVLRVVEHKEPQRQALADVAGEIRSQLAREKARKALSAEAEALVNSGQASAGKWQEVAGMLRSGDGKLAKPLVDRAFQLAAPAAGKASMGSVELADGDVAVVAVARVQPGDLASLGETERQAMGAYLQRSAGMVEFELLRSSLNAAAEIVRH